ncbi:MAG TPA: AAA family ATPase, partial [Chloroflexota bacterium]|nr:AAA family ATPase [Chloroflexota bacterium]
MRFESLTAHGFGPLRGRTVTFAPGINVLYGANECGKSTLHAALFAGLCGVRRGRGAARKDDQEFADRHRPWDGAPWSVSTVVVLADGRRIELQQDLDGKVACRAIDLTLGVDCSAEIMHEGTPDGSLWLGFNRRTFLATACVRQAAVLGVCGEAEQLQEQLQRATATAGADGTVAEAIARIEQFRAAHVGRDWSTSVRPLRRAMNRVEAQRQALDDARRAYGRYLALAAELESLEEQAAADERRCRELRAGLATQQAEALEGRLRRARELWASFPDGEPPGLVGEDDLPRDMAAALRAWEERRGAPGAPPRLGRWVWLGLGAVLAVAGVAVLWRGATSPGLLLLAAGLALGAGALWRAGRARGSCGAAPPEEGGDLAST